MGVAREPAWETGPVSVPNVLATRYAGADLARIWSPEHKIVLERQLWIAVLKAQRDLGIDVPDGVVEAYEDVVDKVDLVDDLLVGLDHTVGHVDPQVALGFEHGDPQLPLEHDLVLRRPDRGEVVAGVPGREHVGHRHC